MSSTSAAVDENIGHYGWTAVPRSLATLVASRPEGAGPAAAMSVEQIGLPTGGVADSVTAYARSHLDGPTFNHSMRVFYYGQAIVAQNFGAWTYDTETWLAACLLHDIGTTDANISSTHLSFEFRGGYLALDLLRSLGAPQSQAEAVAETIIRHQDVGDTGNITTLTAVIHFATLLDNVGGNPELVHPDTIKSVVAAWPRQGWTGCFASVIRKETGLKPWSHTTKIENFAEMVEGNTLMQPYD